MSRAGTSSQRTLTLTEELERLEQSITLTLQEIDHNFSRAHSIVTTSILPVVEKYADHSKEVWEASKFWKQFFEASANVSLSSYQEPTPEDTTITEDTTQMTPSSSTPTSPSEVLQDPNQTPLNKRNDHSREADEPDLTSTPSNMTPRAKIASYSSPYEALKREVQGQPPLEDDFTSSTLSSTPRAQPALQSSPFHPPSTTHSATTAYRTPANDVLLHRILDKNWRIQATPHLQPKLLHHQGGKASETPLPSTRKRRPLQPSAAANDSLDSSPMLPAPELRTDIFSSPLKQPRIPGISILTPARQKANLKADPTLHDPNLNTATWAFDSDSDTSSPQGISPPKTMQFHIPQSRLLKTPAREASKRIVQDLLLSAGGDITDDMDIDDDNPKWLTKGDDSPSVVRRAPGAEQDDDLF